MTADLHAGTSRDAILYAVGSNGQHGKPRSNADKRKSVTTLLSDAEWAKWSDHEIARRCCVSHNFVRTVRASLASDASENGQPPADAGTPEVRKRIDKHGNESEVNVGNIGRKTGGGTPAGSSLPPAARNPTVRQPVPPASAPPSSGSSSSRHGDDRPRAQGLPLIQRKRYVVQNRHTEKPGECEQIAFPVLRAACGHGVGDAGLDGSRERCIVEVTLVTRCFALAFGVVS